MTNKRLQPLTTTRYNSLGLSFSLLKIYRPAEVLQVQIQIPYCLIHMTRRASRFMQKRVTHTRKLN